MLRKAAPFFAVLLACAGIFCLAQAQVPVTGAGLGVPYTSGGGSATYTKGASVAVQFVNFGSSTVTFTGMNGGTNYPSGAVVLAFFGQDQSGYTVSSVTIGGQSATAVSGAADSSNKCVLYQATMPSAETDTASITYSNAPNYAGAAGGYFTNLSSATVSAAGNETFAANSDPQHLSSTLTVPSSGFGFAAVWATATGAASSSSLTWQNVTSSSGDTYAGYATHVAQVGTAHTATAGSGWNPEASGNTVAMSFIACMSAGTWH